MQFDQHLPHNAMRCIVCTLLLAAVALMATSPVPSAGQQPILPVQSAACGVTRLVCVKCTQTCQLSSSRLFLNSARVRQPIAGSKPCFATDLCFNEIRVEARAGDVMAGAGGTAGTVPEVQHQRAGLIKVIYNNFCMQNKHSTCGMNAGGKMVNTAGYYAQDSRVESFSN